MLASEINVRDPYILCENGKYYLYGTRAAGFGLKTAGFDVYVSENLTDWSAPFQCFDSEKYGLNRQANWAPEVHKYKGCYYMLATFTKENNLRGTFILRSESPLGPFIPHSKGAVTPDEWECLDGTLYVENGKPYLVFCHEHTQIVDGTVCVTALDDDLTQSTGEPVTLFAASGAQWNGRCVSDREDGHKITDGPFMLKSENGTLFMIWSTFVDGNYAECAVRFNEDSVFGTFEHTDVILDSDGGHGMIFEAGGQTFLTFHSPNRSGEERVRMIPVTVTDNGISVKNN